MGIRFGGEAPPAGSVISREGKETGRLTSRAGSVALGMVRHEDAVAGAKVAAAGREGELFLYPAWPKPLSKA